MLRGRPLLVRQITRSLMSCPPFSRSDCDDPRALLDVVPERAGIDELELVLLIAQQLAQPRVVEQQAPVLVDDQQGRRTEFQHLAELALVLGNLRSEGGPATGSRR